MKRPELKRELTEKFGSLRVASQELRINYYRLSMIINGWVVPSDEEAKRLARRSSHRIEGIR